MLSRLRANASPAALVLALIALFVAIGGVAGALPGKNSVDSGDIKRNAVKSADIKNDIVTGTDVKESTLRIPAGAVSKDVFGVAVNDAGQVTGSTLPGVTAFANSSGGASYTVRFPRDISGCVASGSIAGGGVAVGGQILVAIITDSIGPRVAVGTYDRDGAGESRAFNLIVAC